MWQGSRVRGLERRAVVARKRSIVFAVLMLLAVHGELARAHAASPSLGSAGALTYRYSQGSSGYLEGHCAKRTHTASGGFFIGGAANANWVTDLAPQEARYWVAGFSGSGPLPLATDYVICKRGGRLPDGYKDKDDLSATPGAHSATAWCPGASHVVGGGGTSIDGWLNSSFPVRAPDGDGWRVRAWTGYFLQVYVVCANDKPKYRMATDDIGSAPDSGFATASCPPDAHVIGGGASTTGPVAEAHINTTYPADSPADSNSTPDDRWASNVANNSGGPKTETVFAICRD